MSGDFANQGTFIETIYSPLTSYAGLVKHN